jgi:hypothetical protein
MRREQAIDDYIDQVMAPLSGSRRMRADIAAELRTGLLDAVDASTQAGLSKAEATAAAIEDFGAPEEVAASFRPELSVCQARRLSAVLVVGGSVIGLLWMHAAQASDVGSGRPSAWAWLGAPPMPLVGAALAIAVSTALVTMAVSGPLTRWLPDRPRLVALAAAGGGLAVAATDLAILGLLLGRLVLAPGSLAPVPVAVAAMASLGRLALARRAAHCCVGCLHYPHLRALVPARD